MYLYDFFCFRAFREVFEGSFKQFLMSWYMFFFQLPYLPEMWLKANDFDMVDTWFNRQHLPDVSRKVIWMVMLIELLEAH